MKTTVVHFKKSAYDIYCGRPSKWGNPFSHKENTIAEYKARDRIEAIQMYEKYLLQNTELLKDLHELKGKVLGCWCKPKSCHCDILAKYANSLDSALF